MRFSLRWLFVVVAIAALFTAGFVFQNEWWTIGIVTVTVAILIAATVAVSLRLAYRPFWLPFCIVGWFYVVISFADSNLSALPRYLITTRLAYELWETNNPDVVSNVRSQWGPFSEYHYFASSASEGEETFASVLIIIYLVQCLCALIFAAIAGAIASYCVRRSESVGH